MGQGQVLGPLPYGAICDGGETLVRGVGEAVGRA